MRMCCSLSGCADVCVAARTCVWLRGRVCGCADVCVTAGRGSGAGRRGLSGQGQRCGELIANCD